MIRVLVVDDSALIRRLVTAALQTDSEIEVAGTAVNGQQAIEMVDELRPDVVTLDIEMPVLDGLQALEQIRARHPRLPVIMFSTLTERGARQTLDALSKGASDYLTKPSGTGGLTASIAAVRSELLPKIKALAGVRRVAGASIALRAPAPVRRSVGQGVDALLIGCSTGGPDALTRLFAELPADLPVPVVVVQHMPPVFTAMLASRLDAASRLTVREATNGEVLRPGLALLAPGDFHLSLRRRGPQVVAQVTQSEPENFCRPAVDVLFRSAVDAFGGNVIAAILTGMGQDGLIGSRLLVERGATLIAQDEESSVVWGMPGAVVEAGLAHQVLPLDRIAGRLAMLARG